MKKKVNIVIGICGSIAAYKSCELIRRLKDRNFNVNVILTESGKKFITPLTLQNLSNNKVYTDMFDVSFFEPEHIAISENANLIVIAPATANIIAKISHGIADDLLTCVVLSTKSKILICPAMNSNMWLNKITQENVLRLKKYGFHIIEPETGKLACNKEGPGRFPPIEKIVDKILKLIK